MDKPHCSHIPTCELYGLFQLKGALRVWQVNYCEGEWETCARYQRACSGDSMPATLLPNGKFLQIENLPDHGAKHEDGKNK